MVNGRYVSVYVTERGENEWESIGGESKSKKKRFSFAHVGESFITACPWATIWSVFIPTPSFEVCEMVARQQPSETTSTV